MTFLLNNTNFLSIIAVFFLSFITFIQIRKYYKNKTEIRFFRLMIFYRFFSVIIIILLFIQPIIYFSKEKDKSYDINIYIDNSKSMKNNIFLDEMHDIVLGVQNWARMNDYNIILNLIGDSTRKVDNVEEITFFDSKTDFDIFRNNVINTESSHYLLVSDGNSPIGVNQQYNFNKKINVLGIGKTIEAEISFDSAEIQRQDDSIFIKILINNKSLNNDLKIDLTQNDKFLDSYKIKDLNTGNDYVRININYLNLDVCTGLELTLRENQNEIDNIKVLENTFNQNKNITLISGSLSNNSKYLMDRIDVFFKKRPNFNYRIADKWNDNFNYQYDKISMLILDNYPSTMRDYDDFKKIFQNARNNNIPILMLCSEIQDYNLLENISELFLYDIQTIPTERKLKNSVLFDYNLSDFYLIEDISQYKVMCPKDKRNLHYDDGSSALCYLDDDAIMFYPNYFKLAYKSKEFNKHINFDKFMKSVFEYSFYGDKNIELYSKKEKYYNNEDISISVLNNSNINLEKIKLYRYDENNQTEVPINKSFKVSKPGKYSFKLIDQNNNIIGNSINVEVEDFMQEDKLKGQNYSFLFAISDQSKGIYYNYEQNDLNTFLDKVKNQETSFLDVSLNNKINFKDYLPLLLLSIFMLSFEWFLRKKSGLL